MKTSVPRLFLASFAMPESNYHPKTMATRHSLLWRRPGCRDKERKRFAALMRKVEAVRIRYDMTKNALAAEIGTEKTALRSWLTGEAIGRKESVAKIKDFLERYSN